MIYEYRCQDCGHIFEVWQKMSDPAPDACEKCGKAHVERIISSTAFALKGSGWYSSGYQKPNGGDASKKKDSGGSD